MKSKRHRLIPLILIVALLISQNAHALRPMAATERKTVVKKQRRQFIKVGDYRIEVPPEYYIIRESSIFTDGLDAYDFDKQSNYLENKIGQAKQAGLIPLLATKEHHPSLAFIGAIKRVNGGVCPRIVSFDFHHDVFMETFHEVELYNSATFWRYGIRTGLISGGDLLLAIRSNFSYIRRLGEKGITLDILKKAVEHMPDEAFYNLGTLRKNSEFKKLLKRYRIEADGATSDRLSVNIIACVMYILKMKIRLTSHVLNGRFLGYKRPLFISYDVDVNFSDGELRKNAEVLSRHEIAGIHICERTHSLNPREITEFLYKIAAKTSCGITENTTLTQI